MRSPTVFSPSAILAAPPANWVSAQSDFSFFVDRCFSQGARQVKDSCVHSRRLSRAGSSKQDIFMYLTPSCGETGKTGLGQDCTGAQCHNEIANGEIAAAAGTKGKIRSRFFLCKLPSCFPSSRYHGGLSCALISKPHDGILKDAVVVLLRELQSLGNPQACSTNRVEYLCPSRTTVEFPEVCLTASTNWIVRGGPSSL